MSPKAPPRLPVLDRRRAAELFGDDAGGATAEYAIATMATVAGMGQLCSQRSSDGVSVAMVAIDGCSPR